MPPKPRPSSSAKKKAASSSNVDAVERPSTKRGARASKIKSATYVQSDNEDLTVSAPSKPRAPATKRTVVSDDDDAHVTTSPTKFRPKSPTTEILEISDSEVEDEDQYEESFIDDEAVEEDDEADELSTDAELLDAELVDGDTMYPEKPVPSSIRLSNRLAPSTPPLNTRNNSSTKSNGSRNTTTNAEANHSPAVKKSPTKNIRKAAPEADADASPGGRESPTKKARISKSVNSASDDDSHFFAPEKQFKGKSKHEGAPLFMTTKEADYDAVGDDGDSQGSDKDSEVYHEDLSVLVVRELPKKCEVATVANQDRVLLKKGLYSNLPNLRKISIEAVRPISPKMGLVFHSKWPQLVHGLHAGISIASITFSIDGQFVNLSRVDPTKLGARALWGNTRYNLCVGRNDTAVCLSPVMIMDSFLTKMNSKLNYSGHYVTGIFHSEEWMRFVSVVGMVTHQPILQIQVWSDAITFGTKGQSTATGGSQSSFAMPNITGMFNLAASPSKGSGNTVDDKIAPLDYLSPIPVYDGRKVKFDYSAQTFNQIDKVFPVFEGEIPRFSYAVVAYVCQVHKIGTHWRIITYARWILLLATPKS